MTYPHRIRVRYGECDMQSVVFNANYLAYINDAIDSWFRMALGNFEELGFDFMLKKITLEWQSPARFGDEIVLAARVSRWGNTSFDVDVIATVSSAGCRRRSTSSRWRWRQPSGRRTAASPA